MALTGTVDCISELTFGEGYGLKRVGGDIVRSGWVVGYRMYNGTNDVLNYIHMKQYGPEFRQARPGEQLILSLEGLHHAWSFESPMYQCFDKRIIEAVYSEKNKRVLLFSRTSRKITAENISKKLSSGTFVIADRKLEEALYGEQLGEVKKLSEAFKNKTGEERDCVIGEYRGTYEIVGRRMHGRKVLQYLVRNRKGYTVFISRELAIRLTYKGEIRNCKVTKDKIEGYKLNGVGCRLDRLPTVK